MSQIVASDKDLLKTKGISAKQVENQLKLFQSGFPDLEIVQAATVKNGGIKSMTERRLNKNIKVYNKASRRLKRVKFVPASGAASRMFKDLFEVLNSYEGSEEEYLKLTSRKEFGSLFYLYENMDKLAAYDDIVKVLEADNMTLEEVERKKDYIYILKKLLTEEGLNYGYLPKGLLKFHKGCNRTTRTPLEEHLVEGAHYAASGKNVRIHFTVSPQHMEMFQTHLAEVKPLYEKMFKVKYDVSFSVQKAETDTIAADEENHAFRDEEGALVFRPGGHGALIENLNDLDADLVFVKNIDNVVQDRLKEDTYTYKKALAGLLLWHQGVIKDFLKTLDKKRIKEEQLQEIVLFMKQKLCYIVPEAFAVWDQEKQVDYLKDKLNRPIRVCGMVRNQGEPGGGPYWVKNEDKSQSLQIVEASQISEDYKPLMQKATHFNPVDLVCYVKDYKGKKFDLTHFVDPQTGFISEKSYAGRKLKALELPGLWNGAMSDWVTIFVEVPVSTFNPVKTYSDLLRQEHLFENDLHRNKESYTADMKESNEHVV